MRNPFVRFTAFAIAFGVLLASHPMQVAAQEDANVLIAYKKPYTNLISAIYAAGGTVRAQYNNIDAIAATIPHSKVEDIQSLEGVLAFRKDLRITRNDARSFDKEGYGTVSNRMSLDASHGLTTDVAVATTDLPENYFEDFFLNNVNGFVGATGSLGAGTIIGVMDQGVAPVPALGGRVIGGVNYVVVDPGLADGLGPNDPNDDPHGTWVATSAAANIVFGFNGAGALATAMKTYLPGSIIPDFFGAGVDGVPLIGSAPEAEIFALRVFNVNATTSNSIILAAFDGAIDLKKNNIVDFDVINGSFGGGTLFAGQDPFFAGMVRELQEVGITMVFSAGNDGPSGSIGGDPGTAVNAINVGATDVAAYERILRDLQFGPGIGGLWRANDGHQVSLFSDRGPTSDGRSDPDLCATGSALLAQGANGGLSIISGTSFSAPQVTGVAALLRSVAPTATPDQIRGALMNGANPNLLDSNPTNLDQGAGFVDALGAYNALLAGAPNPDDTPSNKRHVANNVSRQGAQVVRAPNFSANTGTLVPGQRAEYYVEITKATRSIDVDIFNVSPELPPSQQNLLFGDDLFVSIHTAKTHLDDYLFEGFVGPGGLSFELPELGLDHGLARVTIVGDWTNAGNISADVSIVSTTEGQAQGKLGMGFVAQAESEAYQFFVAPGSDELNVRLEWQHSWASYPTNDLDVLVFDPNFNLILIDGDGDGAPDGLSLDSPERLSIPNPIPGTYTLIVDGFTVWQTIQFDEDDPGFVVPGSNSQGKGGKNGTAPSRERYELFAWVGNNALEVVPVGDVPTEIAQNVFALSQNVPNPFKGASVINYSLPRQTNVSLVIYNASGQVVRNLVSGNQGPGAHSISWDGMSNAGVRVPSGIYLYDLQADGQRQTKKMIMLD